MIYLIFMFVTLALLIGFIALSDHEARRGARFFARERGILDAKTERMGFVFAHVDFSAFLREEVRRFARIASHAIAEFVLQLVRAAERFLTRIVRYLRSKHPVETPPRENAREFVKKLSEFKGQLQITRQEYSQ